MFIEFFCTEWTERRLRDVMCFQRVTYSPWVQLLYLHFKTTYKNEYSTISSSSSSLLNEH